jgi:two-component system chemotaxis sensor kinase CheA
MTRTTDDNELKREELWRQTIERQQSSGLSIRAFCRWHGVSRTTFYRWRQQLPEYTKNAVEEGINKSLPKIRKSDTATGQEREPMKMPEEDPIVAEFIVESREHLVDVENQLLAIEAAGADIDAELVNTVFRAVHSIKGAAGFLGFTVLGQLAHSLENALNLVRNRELIPDAANVDIMLRAADTLRAMVDDIHHSNDVDISHHVTELQQVVDGNVPPVREASPAATLEASTGSAETSAPTPSVTAPATTKPEAASGPQQVATDQPLPAETSSAVPVSSDSPPPTAAESTNSPPAGPTAAKRESVDASTKPATNTPLSSPADTSIRVSVRLLDSLMNLAGELVLSRNQLVQKVGSDRTLGLDSVAARLDQVTSELQEAIMQTRMQVVGTVFGKFPRVVRDLSRQLGKQCELTVEGEEVELDKSIIEAIGDPLTHLVRNSVDHGVESPQERTAAGKQPVGSVILRAFHQAGKVNISITDDGAGIDAGRLKEKAISRGIITQEQAAEIGEREALRLIFHPGFSMAKAVTDVSGRGVGMDVVKTNIEKLGGAVGIETELGRGTTINVKLPLTLAIVPSLIVRCAQRRFAIPQTNIRELVRIKQSEVASRIERVKDAEVFRLRGRLLPLLRLNAALNIGTPNDQATSAVNIIVVEAGHLQYGLIVDGLHDSEEIVVKPLGRHMQECHTLAGATILGDGQVALILDAAGIAAHSELALPEEHDRTAHGVATTYSSADIQTSLLFTNHPDEQFGIPMEAISRLERVRTEQIDSVGGMEVLQYRGASLTLLSLEKHISARPRLEADRVYVVVFAVQEREVGLIVPRLIDIREISTNVDTVTFREPGVIGSLETDDSATRLLDLYELTKLAHPDWFVEQQAPTTGFISQHSVPAEPARIPTILVAEDSGFFRRQVIGFMEEAGYDVVACEDGLDAWNKLQECGHEVDVVVTDIEMPNLDGCQLALRIKQDESLCHLPIVALTSLASEEDMQRGMESGIDDYQVKLDRERLMAAVARYLRLAQKSVNHRPVETVTPSGSYS